MALDISTDTQQIIGIVYSALAIFLTLLAFIVLQTPSKSLIYLQLSYLALIESEKTGFSSYLKVAMSNIDLPTEVMSEFYCPLSKLVCQLAFPLTLMVFVAFFLILFRFITISDNVKEKGLTYHRMHRWFKGLIRWVIMMVTFSSLLMVTEGETEMIASIVLLVLALGFPTLQVVLYYKYPEPKSNSTHKWLQFVDYIRILMFAVSFYLSKKFHTQFPYYLIVVIIVLSSFFYGFKYPFRYKTCGGITYALGETLIIINVIMILEEHVYMHDYNLDIFFLGAIILLDFGFIIAECMHYYRNKENAQVEPEQDNEKSRNNKRYSQAIEDLNASNDFMASDEFRLNSDSVNKSRTKPLKKR